MPETSSPDECQCCAAPKLIFACSGAADVGKISDLAARKLSTEGAGRMFCLAGIGGRVSGIMESTRSAAAVLAIDGCPLDCARKCLEEAGFAGFMHLRLSELGMEKGQSPPDEQRVERVVAEGRKMLLSVA